MSLYEESETAVKELNILLSSVQEAKARLNQSAEQMTKALENFSRINRPLYDRIERFQCKRYS